MDFKITDFILENFGVDMGVSVVEVVGCLHIILLKYGEISM
jgi:hypothetical protein